MITSTPKETRWFDAEVSNPLLVVVHDAETVLLEESLILLFDFLQSEWKYKNNWDISQGFQGGGVCMNVGIPASPLLTSVS